MIVVAQALAICAIGTVVIVEGEEGWVSRASVFVVNADDPFERIAPPKGSLLTDEKGTIEVGPLDSLKYRAVTIMVREDGRSEAKTIEVKNGQFDSTVRIQLLPPKPK